MTYGQDEPQPCDPWQQQYDPAAHQHRMQGPPREALWQRAPYPEQDYPPRTQREPPQPWQEYPPRGSWQAQQQPRQDYGQQQPPTPQQPTRMRSRGLMYAGVAAVVVLAGGGTAYALTSHSSGNPPASTAAGSPSQPLTCKQQFSAWRTGPAKALAEGFKADGTALDSAASAEDIPATDAALKKIGNDANQLNAYPMPACADPAGYWTQILAGIKAAGDNADSTPGLAGLLAAEAPMQHVKTLEAKLNAELMRTVGVKTAI